jgi:hypothetical protein
MHLRIRRGDAPVVDTDIGRLCPGCSVWRVRKEVARPGWPKLVEPHWRNRGRYLKAVRRFLIKTGYAR